MPKFYKPAPDKIFNPEKYKDSDRKLKLGYDFEYLSHWMPDNSKSARIIAQIVRTTSAPYVTISNTPSVAHAFNKCIDQCNRVLSAPSGSNMRTNNRLRTAVRRIAEFSLAVKDPDPFDCRRQSSIKIKDIIPAQPQ